MSEIVPLLPDREQITEQDNVLVWFGTTHLIISVPQLVEWRVFFTLYSRDGREDILFEHYTFRCPCCETAIPSLLAVVARAPGRCSASISRRLQVLPLCFTTIHSDLGRVSAYSGSGCMEGVVQKEQGTNPRTSSLTCTSNIRFQNCHPTNARLRWNELTFLFKQNSLWCADISI